MADENEKDVTTETEDGSATIGADDISETDVEKDTEAATVADDDADEVDFEALMLEEGTKPLEEEKPDESAKSKEEPAKTDRASDILTTLKDLTAKLDALPENQDANFKRLREMNKTLTGKFAAEIEEMRTATATISRFGEEKEVKEKLELVDDLNRYDVKLGYVNPDKAAEKIVQKDADNGYRLAVNLMAQQTDKGYIGDFIIKNVLQLDIDRLEEFQALSRGEIPEGYEGVKAVKTEDLEAIPAEYHEAYKTLTPKLLETVKEGLGQYASQVEKVEALQILRDRQNKLDSDKAEIARVEKEKVDFDNKVDEFVEQGQAKAMETIGGVIERALVKIQFSPNAAQNATMRFGLQNAIFGIQNPMLRASSVNYFKSIGIPEAEIKTKIAESVKLLDEIEAENDVVAYTTARGQKSELTAAETRFQEKVMRLARLGIGLAARAAQATGAAIQKDAASKTKIPENELPNLDKTSLEQKGERKRYTAADYAEAGAKGVVLR